MYHEIVEELVISSPAFKNGGLIPEHYSCDREHTNPPFKIDGIPAEAEMLVLIMEDSDAPDSAFDHWIIWNLNTRNTIEEKRIKGTCGKDIFNSNVYVNPVTTFGFHRYFFKLYVLDAALQLDETMDKETLLQSMRGHVIARSEIMGRYQRQYDCVQNIAVA
jgi:Raf kinase inhibitor-like YbhB/YbcL family protein